MEVFVVIEDWLSNDNEASVEIKKIFTDGDKATRYRQSLVRDFIYNIHEDDISWTSPATYEVTYPKFSDSIAISDKYSCDSLLFTIEKHTVEE